MKNNHILLAVMSMTKFSLVAFPNTYGLCTHCTLTETAFSQRNRDL